MGKAIVLVFFMVGFVVFLVIKYAKAGITTAYKAVNDPEGLQREIAAARIGPIKDQRAAETAAWIAGLLSMQAMLVSEGKGKIELNCKASDDFSLGYVFGVIERVMQMGKHEIDERFAEVGAFVFSKVFGEDKAILLFRRALDLDVATKALFSKGYATGAQDVSDFAKHGSEKAPGGWAAYVHGREYRGAKSLSAT